MKMTSYGGDSRFEVFISGIVGYFRGNCIFVFEYRLFAGRQGVLSFIVVELIGYAAFVGVSG
ncbi:MAG: hypothetical protein U1F63_01775 [Chitinivorax sp.]